MDDKKEYVLVTDIGSTTTKGLLLEKSGGGLCIAEQFDTPTTVEKPHEDVQEGLTNLIREFEKRTASDFGYKGNSIAIEYLTTSSAGGGLQILVFGLSSVETGTIAEMTAYGAGGIVLKTFTVDDKISPVSKMRLMQELHPDMILMAGGIDGGAIAPIVELAEILSLAKPTPKFRQGEKIPLVFCGNVEAREFVADILDDNFEVHIVDNVRPDMETLVTEPAKREIHKLFMENVMERAPGYSGLKEIVSADILPTPAGVEKILLRYAEKRGDNIAMVDIGGATTDIFTVLKGIHNRTVAANIGMSYSLSNILADTGINPIMSHLEGIDENSVRDYIANKTLNPTYVPNSFVEKNIEHACATEGIRIAWEMHRAMNFKAAKVGFLDRRKKWLKDANPWEEVLFLNRKEEFFQLSEISLIIGAGGVISHMPAQRALTLLAEAFKPSGITEIAVDKFFKSPHLGVLSTVNQEEAVRLFERECLEFIGHVIAPMGKCKGKIALRVENLRNNELFEIPYGQTLVLNSGGDFRITCGKGLFLDKDKNSHEIRTEKPIVFDCRGRGNHFIEGSIEKATIDEVLPKMRFPERSPESGEFEIARKLPYSGDILVKTGDEVVPEDIVAENRFGPPRLYIIDINRILGYEDRLTRDEFSEGLLVSEGDSIKIGQNIFQSHRGILGSKINTHSPVRGKITKIEDSGIIILREIQDYDGKPKHINIAKELEIKPKHVPGYFKFKVGDFVEAGRILASDVKHGRLAQSPATGTIKNIDTETGIVTIQYDVSPTPLYAFARGTISDVRPNFEVKIRAKGIQLFGCVGFGGESSGELAVIEWCGDTIPNPKRKIVACMSQIDSQFLRKCAEIGVTGVIAPSIANAEWVTFHGREMGVAVTGDEKIPFPVIITEGFGDYSISGTYREVLSRNVGKTASLSGRTQIRAGVIRPLALIYD